jgi:hypothetical protein
MIGPASRATDPYRLHWIYAPTTSGAYEGNDPQISHNSDGNEDADDGDCVTSIAGQAQRLLLSVTARLLASSVASTRQNIMVVGASCIMIARVVAARGRPSHS